MKNNKEQVKHILTYTVVGLGLTLASCSTQVPITTQTIRNYQLSITELQRIQFYTSEDIILYQGERSGVIKTDQGKVIVKNRQVSQQVIIKKGTPGIIEEVVDDHLVTVSFETGSSLVFGNNRSDGEYRLMSKTGWSSGAGEVQYRGETYLIDQTSGSTYLVFKQKTLNSHQKQERRVTGRKIF